MKRVKKLRLTKACHNLRANFFPSDIYSLLVKKGFESLMIISRNSLLCILLLLAMVCHGRELPVLPKPQYVQPSQGRALFFPNSRFIFHNVSADTVQWLNRHWQSGGKTATSSTFTVGLLGKDPAFDAQVSAMIDFGSQPLGEEGYVLINKGGKQLLAAYTGKGLFYGVQSLRQLSRGGWDQELVIADWPAFAHRAVYDDISRGPVSTVDYVKEQIRRMAELKINNLSFYIEHVVQPLSHPDFAPAQGKFTIAQIKELSAYARDYNMELVGSFQSFGHFEKILALPQYRSMGETSTLISPLDPKARQFLENVIGELCDAFSSPYFNVNCDETFDLTKGRSKPYIDSVGAARFYADHLKFLYDVVKKKGKQLMMWGDIALEHEEVLDMLPKDVIYLTWEYGEKSSYANWIDPFVRRGLRYVVCPGILNSYRMFPDMVMARANIDGFVSEGKAKGAMGVLTTVWDDGGTYLFSGDWYGIYVAAEKSWNAAPLQKASFNKRFEDIAYGTADGRYVKALFQLMELRSLPLTYNLNDQLWQQKILPQPGRQLILNNESAPEALAILDSARRTLAGAKPRLHETDIRTLLYSIDQYRIMMRTRLGMAAIVQTYKSLPATGVQRSAGLKKSIAVTNDLLTEYRRLRAGFRKAWLQENQPHWLDTACLPYDRKIAALETLQQTLQNLAGNNKKPLPPASSVALDIRVTNQFFFKNWMLTGLFAGTPGTLPEFLYAENDEYNKPPSPGDFTTFKGKNYRWQKYSSTEGGITDLDAWFNAVKGSSAYAYCSVTTTEAETITAYLGTRQPAEVFCNGVKILRTEGKTDDQAFQLPLKAGVNHLLIKLNKSEDRPWMFTFRVDDKIKVTNHKHKYQLNAKIKVYEAD
ncbi:family 20 glycosylhydrolase [Nostoc ellipsosporum NOK]|nr:family 20 glycosylhydrolase [Nostoc ellipsosporum NOK]